MTPPIPDQPRATVPVSRDAGSWLRRAAGLALCLLSSMAAQAEDLKIGGSGAGLGTMQLLAQAYMKARPDAKVTVLPSMGSGGGIKAMLAGAIQIAVSSRPLSDGESQAGAVAIELGRTPFVWAVASSNRATEITTQHLVDIYAGKADSWSDGTKLRLVLRPSGDSDSEVVKGVSPAMREAATAAEQRKGMVLAVSDQEAANALEKTPGALGTSTLALMISEKRPLKALALDGVPATAQNLAQGRYPLYKTQFLVTGPKTPPEAQAFIGFIRSAAGRQILQDTGHWVR